MSNLLDLKQLEMSLENIFVPLEDELSQSAFDTPDSDQYTPKSYDEYLSALVNLPVGYRTSKGK